VLSWPPDDDENHASRLQATADSASIGSPDAIAHDFAESQQAGLAAMISLAKASMATEPPPTGTPIAAPPEPPAPSRGLAASAAPTRPVADTGISASALDKPKVSGRPAPMSSGRQRATGARVSGTRAPSWSTRVPWPLMAILAAQVVLALRLIWSNTAFLDEALYLYVGSQELGHWLYGSQIQEFQTFLSGSPALYPPIGAIANALGGLAAARILSLLFMLGTTGLLYGTTGRLFGRPAAALGTALFATLGVTQFLSAFATYDPMALFLLTLSAYLVIGYQRDDTLMSATLVNAVAPVVLGLADATKYAAVLWNPVIIGLAGFGPVLGGQTWRYGLRRAASFTVVLLAVLGAGLMVGKSDYITGIKYTTLDRSQQLPGMGQPASLAFHDTWLWIGVVLVLAAIGLFIASVGASQGRRGATIAVGSLLLIGLFAAPVEQARLGTTVSLQKHLVFGAWFGCILAGYALRSVLRWRVLVAIAYTFVLAAGAWYYADQASQLYHRWQPINMTFIRELRSMVQPGQQRYLLDENVYLISYYTADGINSLQWKNSAQYSYTDPQTGKTLLNGPAFADAIRRRAFTLIVLNFAGILGDNRANDLDVVSDIAHYGGYHVVGYLPPSLIGSSSDYTVWQVNAPPKQPA
jgi:Dolichyl-phosphate-mannose-protein mannosyltransferase